MNRPQFLSRGIDYLGNLGTKLRDLQGFTTLAHELIQNADDALVATSMTFDVREDSLVVDNDGIFSDCLQIEQSDCPWRLDAARKHRCDFHRFRHIATGDKRGEAGTTGAFGIGFIAVYQITDRPELISAGRHWILHEDRPEDQRIEVCDGCPKCMGSDLPGTRFILPWAQDRQSPLRQALQAEPVSPDSPKKFLEELEQSLPIAMLFLKRLRSIAVRQAGEQQHALQRLDEGNSLILTDGNPDNDRIWHILRGDFSEEAGLLRVKHPERIEEKRSAKVTVAIPATDFRTGLLCACLPTQQDTGLPFYTNADFFPTSDRKSVILAEDYQSEWNRQALAAAARAIGQCFSQLRSLLGAQRLWSFLAAIKGVADAVEKDDLERSLAKFWHTVEPHLKTERLVYTTNGRWTTCTESALLLQKEEAHAIPILEALGVSIVHEDLRPYQSLLRSETIGVSLLDVGVLCKALSVCGLTQRVAPPSWPSCLSEKPARDLLWQEIALLLERQQRTPKARAEDEQRLKAIAIAPGRDGALWPCGQIFVADEPTIALFQSLGAEVAFVEDDPQFRSLVVLCPRFDAAAAIDSLKEMNAERLITSCKKYPLLLSRLFAWFEDRRQEIHASPGTGHRLADLSIFPSSGRLRRLDELALPGDFDDHLGLAELVDLSALGGRREFLRDLGMPELDFRTYALSRLPAAFGNSAVSPEKRRGAIALLASRLGEIKDDSGIRDALTGASLVECTDGEWRVADSCYFGSETVCSCLAEDAHLALLPSDHQTACRDLYAWLGVADEPRLDDLFAKVDEVAAQPYSPGAVQAIHKVIAYLGKRFAEPVPQQISRLRGAAWLPARGKADRWYRPEELYAAYQDYLFESQALFLDVSASTQNASRPLLQSLGIKLTPTANLVVKHLLHCAGKDLPVNDAVYRFLNDKAEDPALDLLKDKKCLFLGNTYLAPDQVFWGEHPFGRYRRRLSEELRPYNNLLRSIGVRDAPDHDDARKVLSEISESFGATNSPLDGEAHAVVMACWQATERAIDGGAVPEADLSSLRGLKCVPNAERLLYPPEWMFFENRAGLAAKFGKFLAGNVIPRPLGAAKAMTAAGVRPLSSAVEIRLLECADPADDPEFTRRILDRCNQIGRVLESQGLGGETESALRRLEGIRCESTVSLLICYALSAFNRKQESPPEQVPALYQRDQERLLFVRRDGHVSWPAVGRELATALFPDEDPGRIAAGLKEVLVAESVMEAEATLDELGFARLDTAVRKPPEAVVSASTLGTETPPGTPAPPPGEPLSLTPGEAIKLLLGPGAPSPTQPPPGAIPPEGPIGPGTRPSVRRTSKLRSYVVEGDHDPSKEQDPEVSNRRTAVEEAGVDKVVALERAAGRFPEVMPPKHPGYDIASKDAAGNVVRFIEVKSVSGDWGLDGVEVTHTQFDTARDRADMYWLYVVERANRDDAIIHRIHDPAHRVTGYMFDDGWRAAAERDDSEK